MSGELTDEQIRAWARRTRARKGLPEKITDRALLAKLVTLALAPVPKAERDGGRPAGQAGSGGKGGDDGVP